MIIMAVGTAAMAQRWSLKNSQNNGGGVAKKQKIELNTTEKKTIFD